MYRSLLIICLMITGNSILAQEAAGKELTLTDLSGFKTQAGNWMIVGKVMMDPTLDIHEPPPPAAQPVETPAKKKRKRKKAEVPPPPPPPKPRAVTYEAGTGILLNMNNDSIKDNLVTQWEHGDLLLDLDVMIPKGSNSGVYLQGRYEVQLLDSWGVKDPSYTDIGGIYRNWESEKGKIYMGKAPITNAAKAPGLWQHLSIAFKAPRFDEAGNKIANARFIYVDLNGVRIHENVEVPLPTGGPVGKNEVPFGPLMIQGDHGPVAFRNITYQMLQETELTLKDIEYDYYPGPVADFDSLAAMKPAAHGKLNSLSVRTGHPTDQFGMVFTGSLVAPEAGPYTLRLNQNGAVRIEVAGKNVVNNYQVGGEQSFSVNLRKGENPFTLAYYKSDAWIDPGLGLFDLGSFPRPLHAYDSYPSTGRQAAPIYVGVGNAPRLLRAFLDFEGERSKRLTHTIGVGTVSGTHFIYDLKAGNPVCAWRGDFINATPMWNNRGDGSFRPRGAVQYLFVGPSVAQLTDPEASFAQALNEPGDLQNKGYRIDHQSGMPVFLFTKDSLQLEDLILPDESGNALTRTLSFKESGVPDGFYAKLAQGDQIEQLPNGIYVIDQKYYIRIQSENPGQVRNVEGHKELISPMSTTPLVYTINW